MNAIKITIWLLIIGGLISSGVVCGKGQRYWQFEYLPGISFVPSMPLAIHQDGYPTITMTAHYKTRSHEMPIYYSYRLSSWKGDRGWSLEMNHLKIYLKNTNDKVKDFSVSHGYNQIYVNRHLIKEKFTWIIGGGIVLGHPESIIRDKEWSETGGLWNRGYYLSGISVHGACYFPLIKRRYFVIPVEAKITLGYGQIPIVDGHANVPIVSINFLTGLGFKY